MTTEACADLVQRGDPDRHAVIRAADPESQARLWPLYALNLEVARAPWVTNEPMIAEMRLQWWREAVEEIAQGQAPRAHEVAAPLAAVMRDAGLPAAPLDGMIAARRWDIYSDPFEGRDDLLAYVDATAGNLMWVAALALGAPAAAEAPVRAYARGAGLAAWLQAVPELEARGRQPLPDDSPEAIAALARSGLQSIAEARTGRAEVPAGALPALLTGWDAAPILRLAARQPERVKAARLTRSEFARRGRLLVRALSGRW